MGAIIVVDAFWGDSGKGKVAAFLSQKHNALMCARAGIGTNAGHSIYLNDNDLIKTRQLPMGFLNPTTEIVIGSGVCVNPDIFHAEVERYNLQERVKVDYRCPIILPEHIARESESEHLSQTVGSTKSGSGAARVDFVLRKAKQARDIESLQPYLADVASLANTAAQQGTVIVETSQGTYLSLALSPDYPFVTSDNCTSAAGADDVGLSWRNISGCAMVVKAVPSRVGAGPLPNELSADEIKARGIAEYGVVTGRLRRKTSEIPWEMLEYATLLNGPTEIALTFCDHYDTEVTNATHRDQLTPKVKALIAQIEKVANAPVTVVETGKWYEHIIDLGINQ
ncbi:MAG TPA: adenylosuccinate synthetase [Anaerolineales bacterium]|nr:adenylosuccinate synthetase [Anaerolineales bacterium]